MSRARVGERREIILQTLARMLEERHGERISTAQLADAVGVSEAALYRHFSGKARMFEALLEFIEESLFTRITKILAEESDLGRRLQSILLLTLGFAEKNRGMARLLYGDILVGETERLRRRVAQIYDRLETQLKQIIREAQAHNGQRIAANETASLLASLIEGRIARYARSDFRLKPTADWEQQWALLARALFDEKPA